MLLALECLALEHTARQATADDLIYSGDPQRRRAGAHPGGRGGLAGADEHAPGTSASTPPSGWRRASPYLYRQIALVYDHNEPARALGRARHDAARSANEHDAILEALRRGDVPAAQAALKTHRCRGTANQLEVLGRAAPPGSRPAGGPGQARAGVLSRASLARRSRRRRQRASKLLHGLHPAAHQEQLLADDADGPLRPGACLAGVVVPLVLRADLLQDVLGLHDLLDLGQGDAQQTLQLHDLLQAVQVGLGVEPEAPFQAVGRGQQADGLPVAQGALGHPHPLGHLPDLHRRGGGGGGGCCLLARGAVPWSAVMAGGPSRTAGGAAVRVEAVDLPLCGLLAGELGGERCGVGAPGGEQLGCGCRASTHAARAP